MSFGVKLLLLQLSLILLSHSSAKCNILCNGNKQEPNQQGLQTAGNSLSKATLSMSQFSLIFAHHPCRPGFVQGWPFQCNEEMTKLRIFNVFQLYFPICPCWTPVPKTHPAQTTRFVFKIKLDPPQGITNLQESQRMTGRQGREGQRFSPP